MDIPNGYYIEEDYVDIAGYYDVSSKKAMQQMQNVIDDMKRGNIDYRVQIKDGRALVERRGMILPRANKLKK